MVPGQDDHAAARDTQHLGDAVVKAAPVVNGQHGQRGVRGVRADRQLLGDGLYCGRRAGRAMSDHDPAGLDRDNGARWFVGSCAGADIGHRRCAAQRLVDDRSDARVRSAGA